MSKRLTIDARISAALSDDTISAEIIASLIAEAEAACAAADHAAEKEP